MTVYSLNQDTTKCALNILHFGFTSSLAKPELLFRCASAGKEFLRLRLRARVRYRDSLAFVPRGDAYCWEDFVLPPVKSEPIYRYNL